MRKSLYTLLSVVLVTGAVTNTNAQHWRAHKTGLPASFQAKTVYGSGTSMIVTNVSGFADHQVYYTPDSSTAFTNSASSLGSFSAPESIIVKAQGMLFVGSIGGVFKSHDNGHTWAPTAMVDAVYAMYAINDTLYASVGAGLGIPKMSADTGNTWTTTGYSGALATAYLKYNGIFYIASTGGMHYSTDNGASFNTVSLPANFGGQAIGGIAALNGSVYAVCSNGVFKTSDGATWTNVFAVSLFCIAAVDTSLLIGSATSGIYQSNQNGGGWTQVNTGLPYVGSAAYTSVNYITYNDNFLIASVQGDSAIYITDPADLGLHPATSPTGIAATQKPELTFTMMPNPASNELAIELAGTVTAPATVSIYDITGRRVVNNIYTAQHINISLADIVAGTYFVHITQGNAQSIKKLVVIK